MILMKNKINYEIIAPNGNNSEIVFAKKILKPFDDIAIDFIAELSNRILKDAKLKEFLFVTIFIVFKHFLYIII